MTPRPPIHHSVKENHILKAPLEPPAVSKTAYADANAVFAFAYKFIHHEGSRELIFF